MKKSTLVAACILNIFEALAQVTVSIPYCPSPIPDPGTGGSGFGEGIGGNGTAPVSTTPGVTPEVNTGNGTRDFAGFFPIPSGAPILDGKSYTLGDNSGNDSLTQNDCAKYCASSPYFAITSGTTCTCGSAAPGGEPVASPGKSTACPGDPTQSCGAPGYAIVYQPRSGESQGSSSSVASTKKTSSSAGKTSTPSSSKSTSVSTSRPASTSRSASSSKSTSSTKPASSSSTKPFSSGSKASSSSTSNKASSTSSSSASKSSQVSSATSRQSSSTSVPASTSAKGSSSSIASTSAKIPSSSIPTSTIRSTTTVRTSSSAPQPPTTTRVSSKTSSSPASVSPYGDFSTYDNTLATPAACPADNKRLRTDPFSTDYGIDCGKNLAGDRLRQLHADSSDLCLQACDLRKGCAGVSYIGGDKNEANQAFANCQPYTNVRGYIVDQTANLVVGVGSDGYSNATDYQQDICVTPQNSNNPDTYTDIVGNQYALSCGATLTKVTNLQATAQDTLSACLTYCSILDGCEGAIFTGPGAPTDATVTNCQAFKAPDTSSQVTKTGVSFGVISL